jgi:hypothetical protein
MMEGAKTLRPRDQIFDWTLDNLQVAGSNANISNQQMHAKYIILFWTVTGWPTRAGVGKVTRDVQPTTYPRFVI